MNNAKKGMTRVRYVGLPTMKKVSFDLTDLNGLPVEAPVNLLEHAADAIEVTIANMQSGIFYLKIFDGTTATIRRIILQ